MGTMITLGIGKLEIAWGKNDFYESFSDLFQPDDWKDIKYYYADNIVKIKKGYSRNLSLVKPRLDLLGFTLSRIKDIYEKASADYCRYDDEYTETILTYDEFYTVFTQIDLSKVNTLTEDDDWNFGEYVSHCVFRDEEIQRLLNKYADRHEGEFYEMLPPRLIIRVLCDNPTAQDLPLQWYVLDHVENGWSTEQELVPHLDEKNKFLIVTEGKTDTFILQTVIDSLLPAVSDFFYFIDMQENYPFTGTGNLFNFAAGLTKIKIQNKALIIFDNDDTGISSYKKCLEKLEHIPTLRYYHLPDLPECKSFLTIGPEGESYQDINGKAVAIECFLDLDYGTSRIPMVRWSAFNEKSGQYQGALIAKDEYTRIFKEHLHDCAYNKEKLIFLLNDLIRFVCDL